MRSIKIIIISISSFIALVLICFLGSVYFIFSNWSQKREIKKIESNGFIIKVYREENWKDNANYSLVESQNIFGFNYEKKLYSENCNQECLMDFTIDQNILKVKLEDGSFKDFDL